jgi:hypothetical protein
MHDRLMKAPGREVVLDDAEHNDFFEAYEEQLEKAVQGFLKARERPLSGWEMGPQG